MIYLSQRKNLHAPESLIFSFFSEIFLHLTSPTSGSGLLRTQSKHLPNAFYEFQNVLEIQMGDFFAETKLLKQFPLLPNTNRMQASIHISMAVRPSA